MAQKIIKLGPSHHKWSTACAREFLVGHWEGEKIRGQVSSVTLELFLAQDSRANFTIEADLDIIPINLFNYDAFSKTDNEGLWRLRAAEVGKNYRDSFIYLEAQSNGTSSGKYYKKATKEILIKSDNSNRYINNRFLATKKTEHNFSAQGYIQQEITFSDAEIVKDLEIWSETSIIVNFCDTTEGESNDESIRKNNTGLIFPISTNFDYWVDRDADTYAQLIIEYTQESEGTFSSEVKLGENSTILIQSSSENYTHTAIWKCGERSEEVLESNNSRSISYQIPKEWGTQFPNTEYKKGELILRTYDDEIFIGEKTYEVTYSLPNQAGPEIDDESISVENNLNKFFPSESYDFISPNTDSILGVARYSLTDVTSQRISISVKEGYGASIVSVSAIDIGNNISFTPSHQNNNDYIFTIDGSKYSSLISSNSIDFSIIIRVTDSRNKTVGLEFYFTFYKYIFPTLTYSFIRCDENGIEKEYEGNCIRAKIWEKIDGVLPGCVIIKEGSEYSSAVSLALNQQEYKNYTGEIVEKGEIATDSNYQYELTLTDTAGYSKPFNGIISSVNYLLHFRKKDDGISGYQSLGIGCPAPAQDNKLDIGWPVNLAGGIVDIKLDGDGILTAERLREKLGIDTDTFLSTSGGTISGDLQINGKLKLKDALPVEAGGTGVTTLSDIRSELGITKIIYGTLENTVEEGVVLLVPIS
jgi:hypothetical protein